MKEDKVKDKKISIIKNIILFLIVSILIYMLYDAYKEIKVRTIKSEDDTPEIISDLPEQNNIEDIQKPLIPVDSSYKGYKVDCRLEIPKINLQTNVLADYSENGLKLCASKYYGPDANEEGNYCIAGHNYQKENMFNHLIDLTVGDSVYLTDNKNGMVLYTIYDIYKVKPQNVKPLSQETKGTKEITLITCVNYSKHRLVVKARETI